MGNKKVVSAYCYDVAREIFLKEGKDIELNCISMEQRVCSSLEEIEKFYGVQEPLSHECPICCGTGWADETKTRICTHCTNYAVNRTRKMAGQNV